MAEGIAPSKGGRPRKVSPSDALDLAQHVFWRRGLDGSSLDQLSTATGLPRPSLAATFGDKRALYLATLRRRADANAEAVEVALGAEPSLEGALRRVYEGGIKLWLAGDDGPRGCFLLSTAIAPARDDAEVAETLRASLHRMEKAFEKRFRAAGKSEPAMLAGLAAATLHYLAIRTRAGDTPAALRRHARRTAAWLSQEEAKAGSSNSTSKRQ